MAIAIANPMPIPMPMLSNRRPIGTPSAMATAMPVAVREVMARIWGSGRAL